MRVNNWEATVERKKDFLPYYIGAGVLGCIAAIMLMFFFEVAVVLAKLIYHYKAWAIGLLIFVVLYKMWRRSKKKNG